MAALASSFVIAALPLAAAIPDGNYRVMTCRRCPDAADGLRGPARLTARPACLAAFYLARPSDVERGPTLRGGSMNFETAPQGDHEQARTADHPVNRQAQHRPRTAARENSAPNQWVGMKTGKRGKTRGGMILRFPGGRESDSFWECRGPGILTVCRTPS
jgi:hypothetical protein